MNTYKEEQILKQDFGNKAPFRVPEGYFEDFAERMMAQLPAQETKVVSMRPWWHRYRASMFAAACVCAVVFSIGVYLGSSDSRQASLASAPVESVDNTMDEMADYVMMDNEAIYASLSDNQ
ncbi:hypothetical protein [Prevotella sp. KH2C16]|uniref:hypothetical protein n=1 Tax=Prevotella sp. KH2C16 TaxID=1855325 RepID=UPI0008E17D2B|nr:hypothetical protein [Prevotella sp. KH2C16]SFF98371.1 hypothetical protein SAMN05216383_103103 [Prevotella sp. KH2C16]